MSAGTAPAGLFGLALGKLGEGAGGKQGEEVGGAKVWWILAVVAKEASGLPTTGQSPAKKGPPRRKTRLEKMIFRREMRGGLTFVASLNPVFPLRNGVFSEKRAAKRDLKTRRGDWSIMPAHER
jgi:hypothetical protein